MWMTLIPTMNVHDMAEAVAFYTGILDFEPGWTNPPEGDPAYASLFRNGHELHLSSYSGRAGHRQTVVVLIDDADAQFAAFRARGFVPPDRPESPVHTGPVDQSWGTREFYIDDPSGNTLCFMQR
ncbi:VOC family protein [Sphingomonas sp. AOB5]|uniref:bleomycin resistance protein n=1 Tax=Sphingomonas sp. AOB5 TaxID=3034017 RepID=UPI003211D46B